MSEVRNVPLAQIVADPRLQPRVTTRLEVTEQYVHALVRRNAVFPPLDVFFEGGEYWLADGFHRRAAYEIAGVTACLCTVHAGGLMEALWFTCSANSTNGQARTQEDVRFAIERALRHEKSAGWSDRMIADHVGCAPNTVTPVREHLVATAQIAQLKSRVGKDGKERVPRAKAAPEPDSLLSRMRRVADNEPEQLDLEDAIAAAVAAGGPTLVPIDTTWSHLMHATDAVVRAHKQLPEPLTAAANYPLDLAYGLEIEDVRRIAGWWAEFLPFWEARQPDIQARARRNEALGRELNNVA